MTLRLSSICSFNLEGTPLVNSIYSNISNWRTSISSKLKNPVEDNELQIVCLQGVYGYRTGFIGYIANSIAEYLSRTSNPTILSYLLKQFWDTDSNDYEIIAFLLSVLSRVIPINNIVTYDVKESINVLEFSTDNYSQPGVLDLRSLFLHDPIFDSGCVIYSNRRSSLCGFDKWENSIGEIHSKNKGITWAFYRSDNKGTGILVINVDFNENNNDDVDTLNLEQVICAKNRIEEQVEASQYTSFSTYIAGNFNIPFNISKILPVIEAKRLILEKANIKIISDSDSVYCNSFIMSNVTTEFESEKCTVNGPFTQTISSNPIYKEEDNEVVILEIPDNIKIEMETPVIKDDYFEGNVTPTKSVNSDDWVNVE